MNSNNENNINCAKELLDWAKNNHKLIVNKSDNLFENIELYDIVIRDRNQEEKLFLKDYDIYTKLRRGNLIISYLKDGKTVYKIGRKGLIKFFDFNCNYLKKDNNLTEKIRILEPVKKSFDEGKNVIVYLTEKANGENFQISYEQNFDTWIIASKNVSIICRNRTDLTYYKAKELSKEFNYRRYNYCVEFAETWFNFIDNPSFQDSLKQFKNEIIGHTLIGEIVGDVNHEHIKLYSEKSMVFYAIVKNESNEICLPLQIARNFCNKFGLNFVKYSKSSIITCELDFESYMKETYANVFKLGVDTGGEGVVAYISKIHENNNNSNDDLNQSEESIISLCKLKTFEYQFLRKVRDKIEMHMKKKTQMNFNTINQLEKECANLIEEENMSSSINLDSSIEFAKYVFSFIKRSSDNCNFTQKYATFINDLKSLYKSGELLTNDLIHSVSLKYIVDDLKTSKNSQALFNNNSFDNKKIFFKKGKLYFLTSLGLIAGGKSTLFSIIEKEINNKYSSTVNLLKINSDKIKEGLVEEYLKNNPNSSSEEAFENTINSHKFQFQKELENIINNERDSKKINIVLVDKNFPADHVKHFCKEISKNLKNSEFQVFQFYPKILYPIINIEGLTFPFSWSYIIQCYYRLKNRKGHETLDFEKNPKAHYILLCFLNLYKNYKTLNVCENVIYQPTIFHDEKDIKLTNEIVFLFKEISYKTGKNFNLKNMENFDNLMTNFFSNIEESYPSEIFLKTINEMENEIEIFLSEKLIGYD